MRMSSAGIRQHLSQHDAHVNESKYLQEHRSRGRASEFHELNPLVHPNRNHWKRNGRSRPRYPPGGSPYAEKTVTKSHRPSAMVSELQASSEWWLKIALIWRTWAHRAAENALPHLPNRSNGTQSHRPRQPCPSQTSKFNCMVRQEPRKIRSCFTAQVGYASRTRRCSFPVETMLLHTAICLFERVTAACFFHATRPQPRIRRRTHHGVQVPDEVDETEQKYQRYFRT
jgi:hypothetical protein